MKDTELRGVILKKFYAKRGEGPFQWSANDFMDIPVQEDARFEFADVLRICEQLAAHRLVDWKSIKNGQGVSVAGCGNITAGGVDVIEGKSSSTLCITHQNITVQGSSHVQIGDGNVQDVRIQIELIVQAINSSKGSDSEKAEAKSRLEQFLEHPLVSSILGGLVSRL